MQIPNNFNLVTDLSLLVYSYLYVEEILTIFRNNTATRDKIIRLYYRELPNINLSIKNRDLEVVKYLYRERINIGVDEICLIEIASWKGHLEVVKYLYERGVRPASGAINWATEL